MKKRYVTSWIIFSALLLYSSCSHDTIDFNSDVRPILNKHCLACHGGVKAQSGLSFLFEEDAYALTKSGQSAIVRGNAHASELFKRITSDDPDLLMPADRPPLSEQEIKTIEQWINEGASWGTHWAYLAPDRDAEISAAAGAPAVNEIDHFIMAQLDEQNLKPSARADAATLLRRVSLDLTGLPPTPAEAQLYLSDTTDTGYERLIDHLLASDHFGERWASVWLDLARYADSQGYQKDLIRRSIWRYRDWVIHAFNQDMPFNQFTIEQIAGDLLPDATEHQILATAFHRNTMTNDEGGTDDEEFRVAAVLDRVNTTFEIWQGTTIACVQCHSHPYDPIKHEEYYGLYAFFNNTADRDNSMDLPVMELYSPIDHNAKIRYEKVLTELKSDGDTLSDTYQEKLKEYLQLQPAAVPIMSELPKEEQRSTHVFEKGNWLVHGKKVDPHTPGFLTPFDESYSKDRLGLAKWLVSPENPLTARVIVNRFWEQLFGRGLVATLEDFGTQGDPPSHQELLDWLAVEFMTADEWSVKTLLKKIVLSHTYRQSSQIRPKQYAADPLNVYLSRGSRYRLSAEAIRDQALQVSGLFNSEVYGASVMPHQPEGVWNVIRHAASWRQDTTGDQYRRALYTFWRRVSPYPSMQTFDVPSRELCVSRRIRTNTPLQALVTLNDPVFVEAAEQMARGSLAKYAQDIDTRISDMYYAALMKTPEPAAHRDLLAFYNSTVEDYQSKQETHLSASEIDFYATVNVANVILNLDEFIMRN